MKRISKLKVMLFKVANRDELDKVYKELMASDRPLYDLYRLFLKSKEQEMEGYIEFFKDYERARDFYERYCASGLSLEDGLEEELVEEFGQESVDKYIFGIGNEHLVPDDYQEILLKLLDTHRDLSRRRDKSKIKERFGISVVDGRAPLARLSY